MHFRLQLVIEGADGVIVETDQLASLERVGFGPATAGLTLDEAKSLLAACQKHMILAQARDYETMIKPCRHVRCLARSRAPSNIVLRTLFGSLTIPTQRLYHCRCACPKRSSFSPIAALFPERSTPELIYLQTKWDSLMSYGLTCDLLADILPLEHRLSPRSVRRQLHRVANCLEADLGDEIGMISARVVREPLIEKSANLPLGASACRRAPLLAHLVLSAHSSRVEIAFARQAVRFFGGVLSENNTIRVAGKGARCAHGRCQRVAYNICAS